jgi:asparagine synthase (glutamine-hydrolysing)
MCGIFGAVFLADGEAVHLEPALDTLFHRGPDDDGVFHDRGVVLGFRRLAILDLTPAGGQPMVSADGSVVVVCNGEIYNHHELRDELAALGHRFRSRSDTEVIVEGYAAWGEGVIERLDGMFAIGLWDARRRRLLLGRDRAGKKPLFYAHDRNAHGGSAIRFASEAKAILASGHDAEIDLAALPYLLSYGYTPAPGTMYRGISQLPPATLMSCEEGKAPRLRRYWRAPFTAAPLKVSLPEATAEIRRLFDAAVRRRLEADVPLGAFLSGGLDSTIVVGTMARLLGPGVRTFSIGFAGDPRYDETAFARLAARAFATEHVEVILEPSSFALAERLVALHDGPFGDSSAIPSTVVAMLAREHVTVALTGDGGDELFCGYQRFLAAEAAEVVPAWLLRLGAGVVNRLPAAGSERSPIARAQRFLAAARLPLADRLARWSSLFAFELDRLLRPEIRAQAAADAPLDWMRAIVAASRGCATLARILDHNFATYLPCDLLVKADRTSMAHSLELRSPFLDTALVEYVSRLPDSFKRRGVTTKWILRRAFRDLLPPLIARRGKMGFGIPLGTWFRGGLKEYLCDHLSATAALYDFVDRPFVERLLDDHLQMRADHGHRLWLLLTLELWLRSLSRARFPGWQLGAPATGA